MRARDTEVGGSLAKNVCAETPKETLFKELWDVATAEERKVIANLIFKLVW